MWTVDAIKAEIESFIEYANEIVGDIPSAKDVPVEIDGRLSKTMAYFMWETVDGKLVPNKFKFAKNLFLDYNKEQIIDTIKHEIVHYIVNLRYQKNMGHNETFLQFCKILGVSQEIYFKESPNKVVVPPRYNIKCGDCGAIILRKKMGQDRALEILTDCQCGRCKSKFKFIYDSKLDEVMYVVHNERKNILISDCREIYEEDNGMIFEDTFGRLK